MIVDFRFQPHMHSPLTSYRLTAYTAIDEASRGVQWTLQTLRTL